VSAAILAGGLPHIRFGVRGGTDSSIASTKPLPGNSYKKLSIQILQNPFNRILTKIFQVVPGGLRRYSEKQPRYFDMQFKK
jgi:hypothetical protein